MQHSIIVENISKTYNKGKIQALSNISFEIKKGELFGFIGPDGAGKTSLFRILATLLKPDSGKTQLEGLDCVKDYKAIRKIIGYMPGRFSLYQDLSVEENLKFFATIFGTSIEENYPLIKDIYGQIEPYKTRLAGKLSGGMKQKLALSCAMIHEPKVLILDEPTTGVDAVSRIEFWEMLKRLKNKGITIIVATPYMDEASLCDKVALIQSSKILSIDTPENITKQHKKNIYAITSNKKYSLVNDLRGYSTCYTAYLFGENIHYTDKQNTANTEHLQQYLQHLGHEQIHITMIPAGIEDCFMDLMNNKIIT